MPVDLKELGLILRKRREALGVNQAELARRVGVTEQYLGMLEVGRRSPSLELLERLAVVFDCKVWPWLFYAEGGAEGEDRTWETKAVREKRKRGRPKKVPA